MATTIFPPYRPVVSSFSEAAENALGADHRDEDGRVLVLIARQVHVEVVGAVIIINDGGSRPGLHGIVRLDIERNTAAAGDQDDLAG